MRRLCDCVRIEGAFKGTKGVLHRRRLAAAAGHVQEPSVAKPMAPRRGRRRDRRRISRCTARRARRIIGRALRLGARPGRRIISRVLRLGARPGNNDLVHGHKRDVTLPVHVAVERGG